MADFDIYKKQARAKFITHSLAAGLLRYGDDRNKSAYMRMLNCSSILTKDQDRLKKQLCGNKLCVICSRIKTANLINGYFDELNTADKKDFVTLTVPNCTGPELKQRLAEMTETFSRAKRDIKKRFNTEFIGIRHFEVTYNDIADTYHPHIHLILKSRQFIRGRKKYDLSKVLIYYWIKLHKKRNGINCQLQAQDSRPADNKSLKEIFKYNTKTIYKKTQRTGRGEYTTSLKIIPPRQLDIIFSATERRRMFQSFGSIKKKPIEKKALPWPMDKLETSAFPGLDVLLNKHDRYYWTKYDWIHAGTGELLSGYKPTHELELTLRKKCYGTGHLKETIIKHLYNKKEINKFVADQEIFNATPIDQQFYNEMLRKQFFETEQPTRQEVNFVTAINKALTKRKYNNGNYNPFYYGISKAV